ncbi:hypothetical protein JVT61DRAFT_10357 [Boletus reticuloceps]|uniref:Uncharacterized protein n=1 Tax=Boletus reticuloceps TaxID=495285 RepID=A0A8I2YWL8_9AGAM|nr:hypothetical protein JVT61DRAFT_10357 [Boletus reticuloceps]
MLLCRSFAEVGCNWKSVFGIGWSGVESCMQNFNEENGRISFTRKQLDGVPE